MKGLLGRWASWMILLGMMSGCGKPLKNSDLLGTYTADFGFATETLTLRADGQFLQHVKLKREGKTVSTNGTWRFDSEDKDIYFSEAFLAVKDGFGNMVTNFNQMNRASIYILPVRRSFGTIEIGGDDVPWGRRPSETPYRKTKQR
jgi:hypothetical protein